MSSTVPVPISQVAADENDIVVETEHAIEQGGTGTSISNTAGSFETPNGGEPTLEAEAESTNLGEAQQGSWPRRIPLHPALYHAAVYGHVDLLKRFLQSQDLTQSDGLHPLQGVSIGDNRVLHIAATSSSHHLKRRPSSNYVGFIEEVYMYMRSMRNRSMLTARNKLKETPLHCAAKAGNYRIFSSLISFVKNEHQDVMESLLTARNIHGETALHEAVRVGHIRIVEDLIHSEPRLAVIVDTEGVSPLYLATMSNNLVIVKVFTGMAPSLVSCAGPKGQTSLHAAVLEHYGFS